MTVLPTPSKHRFQNRKQIFVSAILLATSAFAHSQHQHSKSHGRSETSIQISIEDWRNRSYRCERENHFRRQKECHSQVSETDRQFTYERNDGGFREHYFRNDQMVSYDIEGPNGRYHYFENAEMVSIDDNRSGYEEYHYYHKK